MSTKLTIKSAAAADIEQPLGQALINANQWLSSSLLHLMRKRGHTDLTGAHLTFFSNLNCGMTHASEVARRMAITRQAVYKITKELQRMDVLALEDDPVDRRQKIISMTKRGERIALDARASLEQIENHLTDKIGKRNFDALLAILRKDWGPVLGVDDT